MTKTQKIKKFCYHYKYLPYIESDLYQDCGYCKTNAKLKVKQIKNKNIQTYQVEASEVVYYSILVKASSEQEAREKVLAGRVKLPDAHDSGHFEVDTVIER